MRADSTARLTAAARQRHEQTLARARTALRHFEATGEPITYARVAAAAKVSRAWLYSQPDVRAAVERLRDINGRSTAVPIPRQRTSEASLVRRLEAAHRRNQELTRQVTELRAQLAATHGALRDSRVDHPMDAGSDPRP